MMTKRQACHAIIDDFQIHLQNEKVTDSHILQSSNLAVAMEYLGLITKPELQDYAASRGGSIMPPFINRETGEIAQLSFRALLSLLPD